MEQSPTGPHLPPASFSALAFPGPVFPWGAFACALGVQEAQGELSPKNGIHGGDECIWEPQNDLGVYCQEGLNSGPARGTWSYRENQNCIWACGFGLPSSELVLFFFF